MSFLIVGRVDDERVAFPVAAGIAEEAADRRRRVGTAVERDDPRLVDHLLKHHHVRRLDNLEVVVVAARQFGAPRVMQRSARLRSSG